VKERLLKAPSKTSSEFQKFDTVMRKVLSVSHDELKRREKKWKEQRAKKKRGKT
jgi:hypothetical protein